MKTDRQQGFTTIEGVILLVVAAAICLGGWWVWQVHQKNVANSINSYGDCVKAGYPVQASYPTVCSAHGKSFVNPDEQGVNPPDTTGLAVLSGTVTAGPTTPTCAAGSSCESVISQHIIEAEDSDNKVVATSKTDNDGKYTFYLKPGHYKLVLVPQVGLSAKQNEVDVVVGDNKFDLQLDTGIR